VTVFFIFLYKSNNNQIWKRYAHFDTTCEPERESLNQEMWLYLAIFVEAPFEFEKADVASSVVL
jgi:hypothetical protein